MPPALGGLRFACTFRMEIALAALVNPTDRLPYPVQTVLKSTHISSTVQRQRATRVNGFCQFQIMVPWPLPTAYQSGSALVWMADNVELAFQRFEADLPADDNARENLRLVFEDILRAGFERLKRDLFANGFVPDMFYRSVEQFEPNASGTSPCISQISVVKCALSAAGPRSNTDSEAYELDITEQGQVQIRCSSHLGGLHAFTTLSQLFFAHSALASHVYCTSAPIKIRDKPLFEHRGINVDIARNRIFPADLKRTLDAMAFSKLNRLHLHATDSQSWPLDIPALPELAARGAYNQRQIWSAADLELVQKYGAARGIEVYVEIDMPSHMGAVHHSHPELVTAYNAQPWEEYAQEPPAGQLRLNSAAVRDFITEVLGDLLPRTSKHTSCFHVGGDELNSKSYELDPGVLSSNKAILQPLLQEFYDHAFSVLAAHGMTPLIWEEVLLNWDIKLPESAVVQVWQAEEGLAKVVGKGHRAIFGPSSHWYLDAGVGSWVDPDPTKGAETAVRPPYNDWNSPYKSWRQVYSYDPLHGIPSEHHHFVIGGEVHLWSELNDSVTIDGKLWPRSSAAAEIMWRRKGIVSEDVTRRLAEVRERLLLKGIAASVVQMEWCLQNPGSSVL